MDTPKDMDLKVPPSVTLEIFKLWRDARRGRVHPESQNNPYWAWLLQSETSAWAANQYFDGPSSFGGQPIWSADRFGQSITQLADGRKILIAGEHEDYYDPDFFIYNDVAVVHPSGEVDFYGYPIDAFPPTDFHSATLRGDQIILIGNLGYPDDRNPGTCPILILDTATWLISKQASTGDHPGWIHRHRAELAEDGESILIRGGTVCPADPGLPLVENIDDWRLRLTDWCWERLTERKWPLFEISRADNQPNRLWELRQAVWQQQIPALKELSEHQFPLPKDPGALETLYTPNQVPHQQIPPPASDEDGESEYGVTRIAIDGVVVRYVEDFDNILLTVEGELARETIDALVDDVVTKLSKLEETEYRARQIRP